MLTLKLNAIQVLALSAFGVMLGIWLKKKVPVLDRLNIPASIAGGLVYAVLQLLLRDRVVNLDMELVLRDVLMVTFFTTIGMSASLRLIRAGGIQVLLFFLMATAAAVLQNILGITLAAVFRLDLLLGIVSGSVALTGGPATALAFGPMFERMGVAGATTLGVASAMFGITAGGLVGGYIGGWLIRRHKLSSVQRSRPATSAEAIVYAGEPHLETATPISGESESEHSPLLQNVIAVAIAMGLGTLISSFLESRGLVLPSNVGAMLAAAIIRNLDDWLQIAGIDQHHVDRIGNISLYLFIVMALLTLRLWELAHLALPMVVVLAGQVALVWLLCITASYYLMGRDYESAVIAGGFCGFMLGTTANAMACMDVLVKKYGPAPKAFIVVPLVGAFLIDFTNAVIITAIANLLR
jgi:ESS family glutamate:Na+ symporter